jgi:hypothetical protein
MPCARKGKKKSLPPISRVFAVALRADLVAQQRKSSQRNKENYGATSSTFAGLLVPRLLASRSEPAELQRNDGPGITSKINGRKRNYQGRTSLTSVSTGITLKHQQVRRRAHGFRNRRQKPCTLGFLQRKANKVGVKRLCEREQGKAQQGNKDLPNVKTAVAALNPRWCRGKRRGSAKADGGSAHSYP